MERQPRRENGKNICVQVVDTHPPKGLDRPLCEFSLFCYTLSYAVRYTPCLSHEHYRGQTSSSTRSNWLYQRRLTVICRFHREEKYMDSSSNRSTPIRLKGQSQQGTHVIHSENYQRYRSHHCHLPFVKHQNLSFTSKKFDGKGVYLG